MLSLAGAAGEAVRKPVTDLPHPPWKSLPGARDQAEVDKRWNSMKEQINQCGMETWQNLQEGGKGIVIDGIELDATPMQAPKDELNPSAPTPELMDFYVYWPPLPEDHPTPDMKRPVLLWLHGTSGCKDTMGIVSLANCCWWVPYAPPELVVLIPQNNSVLRYWFTRSIKATLIFAVEKAIKIGCDPERCYVSGMSMGAIGAYNLAQDSAEGKAPFCAAVPISGQFMDVEKRSAVLRNFPLWAFHGKNDQTISVEYDDEAIARILLAGANTGNVKTLRYTRYDWSPDNAENRMATGVQNDGRGHGAHEQAFADPELWEWLLAQRRGAIPQEDLAPEPVADAPEVRQKTLQRTLAMDRAEPGRQGRRPPRAVNADPNKARKPPKRVVVADWPYEAKDVHAAQSPEDEVAAVDPVMNTVLKHCRPVTPQARACLDGSLVPGTRRQTEVDSKWEAMKDEIWGSTWRQAAYHEQGGGAELIIFDGTPLSPIPIEPPKPECLPGQYRFKPTKLDFFFYWPPPPEGFTGKRPLILFLHGAAACQDELGLPILSYHIWWLHRVPQECIVAIPWLPTRSKHWCLRSVKATLLYCMEKAIEYGADPERLYVTGSSMGGTAAWELAVESGERGGPWAAVVPVTPLIMDVAAAASIVHQPTWIFCGGNEWEDLVERCESAVSIAVARGANSGPQDTLLFTKYDWSPSTFNFDDGRGEWEGHATFEQAYADEDLFTWMLAQRRKLPKGSGPLLDLAKPRCQRELEKVAQIDFRPPHKRITTC